MEHDLLKGQNSRDKNKYYKTCQELLKNPNELIAFLSTLGQVVMDKETLQLNHNDFHPKLMDLIVTLKASLIDCGNCQGCKDDQNKKLIEQNNS